MAQLSRFQSARIAGQDAQQFLDILNAIEAFPQDEEAWNKLAEAGLQLASSLSELNDCIDEKVVSRC